jgi:superfamily II DNA or RNA helicase
MEIVKQEKANNVLKIVVKNIKSQIILDKNQLESNELLYVIKYIDSKMAFYAPNYENSKEYNTRNASGERLWDGKIHLLNPNFYTKYFLEPLEFYTGKINDVIILLYHYGYKVKIEDERFWHKKGELVLEWNKKYEPFDYQEDAVDRAVKEGRGILCLATSAGKTNIGARIIYKLAIKPCVFFVTTKDLMYQAKERFESLLNTEVGIIGDGECNIKDINICMVQTCFIAFGLEEEYKKQLKKFDSESFIEKDKKLEENKYVFIRDLIRSAKMLIFDEAHHIASETCRTVLEFAENATYRFALGATIERDDGLEKLIEALFGRYIINIPLSDLIKRGKALAPEIIIMPVNTDLGLCENYSAEYKTYITENKVRNNMIAELAIGCAQAGKTTLCLVKMIPHGEDILRLVREKAEEKGIDPEKIVFFHGKVKNRQEIIDKTKNKEILCMIATSVADEGLDIQSLEILIMAGGGKSKVKIIQRVGRIVRIDYSRPLGEKKPVVFDFREHRKAKYLRRHCNIRQEIYKKESEFIIRDLEKIKSASKPIKNTSWEHNEI